MALVVSRLTRRSGLTRPRSEMAVNWQQLEQIQPSPGVVRPNTQRAVVAEKATRFVAGKSATSCLNT